MFKGARLWARDHRFIDLSSFGSFLLFLLGGDLSYSYKFCEQLIVRDMKRGKRTLGIFSGYDLLRKR